MIRVLIAVDLGSRAIDRLNEIPEFEIVEKKALPPGNGAGEMNGMDAVVIGAMEQIPPALLAGAVDLKIIILTGSEPNPVAAALAKQKNIEIRSMAQCHGSQARRAAAENPELLESEVIAVLKDFFNV